MVGIRNIRGLILRQLHVCCKLSVFRGCAPHLALTAVNPQGGQPAPPKKMGRTRFSKVRPRYTCQIDLSSAGKARSLGDVWTNAKEAAGSAASFARMESILRGVDLLGMDLRGNAVLALRRGVVHRQMHFDPRPLSLNAFDFDASSVEVHDFLRNR